MNNNKEIQDLKPTPSIVNNLNIVDGKMEVKEVIKLLESMQPKKSDSEYFDESRKLNHIYCIEYGIKKQKQFERLVYQRTIDELKATTNQ